MSTRDLFRSFAAAVTLGVDSLPDPAGAHDHTLQIALYSSVTAVLVALITTVGVIYVNRRPRPHSTGTDTSLAERRRADKAERQLAALHRFLAARGFDAVRIVKGDESDDKARFRTGREPADADS